MSPNELRENIEKMTYTLTEIIGEHCSNKISSNYSYIITFDGEYSGSNRFERDENMLVVNESKIPVTLDQLIENLTSRIDEIYELDIFPYKSEKDQLIVEVYCIIYNENLGRVAGNNTPLLHVKLEHPPYHKDKSEKFDLNWKHGGIRNRYRMLKWRLQAKQRVSSRKS